MLRIEIDREDDGRWIGEVPEVPGVLAYGETRTEAQTKVTALALHTIADRIEHGEGVPFKPSDLFKTANPSRSAAPGVGLNDERAALTAARSPAISSMR